jgi:hypothetical protein
MPKGGFIFLFSAELYSLTLGFNLLYNIYLVQGDPTYLLGLSVNQTIAPYPFWGAHGPPRYPFCLGGPFLYNRLMDIVEDLFPVRRDIDDHIDDYDSIGID